MKFADPDLVRVWDSLQNGVRLSRRDGDTLMGTDDLIGLGRLADWVKRQRHGNLVYFVINRYINPTNICVLRCKFCDFAKRPDEEGAYELSPDQVIDLIEEDVNEVHMVGGHHPQWPFERYVEMIELIRSKRPNVQIKAFTAAEIDYFWRRWKIPPQQSLSLLKDAGLDAMPGGGAEVLTQRIWKALHPGKAGPDRYLEIHRIAHTLGIPTNATMLYGHIETPEERVEHLMRLRAEQDEVPGFKTFIPLAYQINRNKLRSRPASAHDDLRMIAVSRLLLDNFDHVEAFWIDLGVECAGLALHFGASDVNGTLGEEKIAHAADAKSPTSVTRDQLVQLIRSAGKTAVERDALYNHLRTYDETGTAGGIWGDDESAIMETAGGSVSG